MPGLLLHSVGDIIKHLLVDLGYGSLVADGIAWPIAAEAEMDTPDNTITVYSTLGLTSGDEQRGELPEFNGIMIRIRSTTHPIGYAKASAIAVALDGLAGRLTRVDSTRYVVKECKRQGEVNNLGKEAPGGKRSLFTINAIASVRKLP